LLGDDESRCEGDLVGELGAREGTRTVADGLKKKSYLTVFSTSSRLLTTRAVVLVEVEVTTYFLVAPTQVLDEPCASQSAGLKSIAGKRERITVSTMRS
jgi:hypothetical protein